jgi:hypothetical protein
MIPVIMEKLLDNIVSSYLASRRAMYLIFYGASSHLPRITELCG